MAYDVSLLADRPLAIAAGLFYLAAGSGNSFFMLAELSICYSWIYYNFFMVFHFLDFKRASLSHIVAGRS